MKWLRLYVDLIDDVKQSQMKDRTFRHFVLMMCHAKEQDENGLIYGNIAEIAWRLRTDKRTLAASIKHLQELQILSNNEPFAFLNWPKRQFQSDDIALRVQRYRNKKCNVTGNVTSNNHETLYVTPPDTDTETDTETETEAETEAEEKKAPKAKASKPKLTDEQWIQSLKENPAYKGIDIEALQGRMFAWCEVKGKKPTRSRLLNWLNREERPMSGNGKKPEYSKNSAGAMQMIEELRAKKAKEAEDAQT